MTCNPEISREYEESNKIHFNRLNVLESGS
jgi:hypothetical protein